MKILVPACAALLILGLGSTLPASARGEAGADKTGTSAPSKGEKELAELLEGYSPGEPVSCLHSSQRDRMQVINDTALVFRDRGTIYVNRTSNPRFIDEFDIPVFRLFGTSLCRLDQVEFQSRDGLIGGPVVSLEDFVPYTKSGAGS